MADSLASSSTYYAVLVGIDDYAAVPQLSGCVGDIEIVQQFLSAQVQGPLVIRKLVAPRPEVRTRRGDELAPTRAGLMATLGALSEGELRPGDRVLFYYSGHGAQTYDSRAQDTRQGLVPQDFRAGAGLLFEVELRALFDRIYARTDDLTVVLDCCHSAGMARAVDDDAGQARFVDLSGVDPVLIGTPDPALGAARGMTDSPSNADAAAARDYPILMACQAGEKAQERRFTDDPKGSHGVLTHALLQALGSPRQTPLAELRWADLWWSLRATVVSQSPQQHPQLLGRREQRVLGGPSPRRAAGLPLRKLPDGRYELGVGTLGGIRPGARIAVYAPAPAEFPPLGSAADTALPRWGELIVVAATLATATAQLDPPGEPMALPTGASARVVAPAPEDALTVTLASGISEALAQGLRATAPADHIRYVDADGEACLGGNPDGGVWLGDNVYGSGTAPEPLAHLYALQQDRSFAEVVDAALHQGFIKSRLFNDPDSVEWTAACFPMQVGASPGI